MKLKSMPFEFVRICILFSALILLSCNTSGNGSEPDSQNAAQSTSSEDAKEIKAVLIDMWNAIETKDMERYAKHIHPDFTQFGENDSILRVGKEAELEGIRSWLEEASEIHTEMQEPMVRVNGKTAWIVYYWKDRGITDSGSFSTRGKSTRIFTRENGKWLCIHGHYTLLP